MPRLRKHEPAAVQAPSHQLSSSRRLFPGQGSSASQFLLRNPRFPPTTTPDQPYCCQMPDSPTAPCPSPCSTRRPKLRSSPEYKELLQTSPVAGGSEHRAPSSEHRAPSSEGGRALLSVPAAAHRCWGSVNKRATRNPHPHERIARS